MWFITDKFKLVCTMWSDKVDMNIFGCNISFGAPKPK